MSLPVTDHAAVRYCERVLGFDRHALGLAMSDLVGSLKTGRFKLPGQDVVAVVDNGTVITFVPTKNPKLKAKIKKPKKLRPIPSLAPHVPWPD